MTSVDVPKALNVVRKQFLCMTPLKNLLANSFFKDLSLERQHLLLENTVNHSLIAKYPLKTSYQKAFLKFLLDELAKQNVEVHEDIYVAYGRLVALSDASSCFKHFELGEREIVTLIEKSAFISEGTTGLSTWEASLVLAEWCIQNKSKFENKSVLELGAGVGLTGITVNLKCQPSRVVLTDCHDTVLAVLEKNVGINCNGANATVLKLPWEEVDAEKCRSLGKIDVIIAADVVYDFQLFHPLADAIKCLSSSGGAQETYLACTERNKNTLDGFVRVLSEKSLAVSALRLPEQKHFVWPTDTEIKLFRITEKLQ